MTGNSKVLDEAIQCVVQSSGVELRDGLTNQDIIYRTVTNVHRVLQELVNVCDEFVHSSINPSDGARLIADVNNILLVYLHYHILFVFYNFFCRTF